MGKTFISVFLFMLFCIVIAFPSYGKSVSAKQNCNQITAHVKSTETPKINFFVVLKKCLLKGISIVEEERPAEESQSETEDEHSSGVEESLLITQAIAVQFTTTSVFQYFYSDNLFKTVSLRGVPEPPPEFIV
jgi:hypothetical protein